MLPLLKIRLLLRLLAVVLAFALLGGCASVQPWERDLLAQPEMQLVPDPVLNGLDEHIYFSKEAAFGGSAVGGGGCGCN